LGDEGFIDQGYHATQPYMMAWVMKASSTKDTIPPNLNWLLG
jgi:hypothetical protein